MSDQCRNCTLYGDIKSCEAEQCFLRENWYVIEMKKENAALTKKLEEAEKERDTKLLSAANPDSGWQGINKECKLWQERAERAEARLKPIEEVYRIIKNRVADGAYEHEEICYSYSDMWQAIKQSQEGK